MKKLDESAAIACSLNDADFRERQAFARKKLITKIKSSKRIKNGVEFHFNPEDQLRDDLTTFVQLERQCCGFLTFTILLEKESGTNPTGVRIEGPPETAATIDTFAQAIASEQTIAPDGNNSSTCCSKSGCFSLGSSKGLFRFKRTGCTGLAIGGLAIIACELPILLAALGLGGLSAGALAFRPPPIVEKVAVIIGLLGAVLLVIHFVRKYWRQRIQEA